MSVLTLWCSAGVEQAWQEALPVHGTITSGQSKCSSSGEWDGRPEPLVVIAQLSACDRYFMGMMAVSLEMLVLLNHHGIMGRQQCHTLMPE